MSESSPRHAEATQPLISNRLYDFFKAVAQVGLPAVGTLYFALAAIWGLPEPEKVVGSITALDAFLGVLLHVSTKAYQSSDASHDGVIEVSNTEAGKTYSLVFNGDVADLDKQSQVIFKVMPQL